MRGKGGHEILIPFVPLPKALIRRTIEHSSIPPISLLLRGASDGIPGGLHFAAKALVQPAAVLAGLIRLTAGEGETAKA